MVGENHVRAIANENIAIDFHSGIAQVANFFEKRNGVKHYSVAYYAGAYFSQHAAGYELQNESLAIDDHRVSGIVASGIAGDDREILRQHVNNFAFALVAPLGADDDRSF